MISVVHSIVHYLQHILRHSIEDVEQRLQLELVEVCSLQRWWLNVVAHWQLVLGLTC
jgi:hypothetical protein